MNTFGFIGTGNMGGALAKAAAKTLRPEALFLADACAEKAQALADTLGCQATDAAAVARTCNYIFLGVKPQVMASMLQEIAPVLENREDSFVLISMAAGLSLAQLQQMLGKHYPLIRIMPNLPVSVGSGVILFDTTDNVTAEQTARFCRVLEKAGLVDHLPEKLIDAASAVSGCGPAFVSLFAESMADGAVACGLPRDKAMAYALQTLEGTARMLRESGMHPGMLKDAVCSPGGTTIAGVLAMEAQGARSAVAEGVVAAYERTLELGQ